DGRDVAAEALVADVELAADEPLRVRRPPVKRLLARLEPRQLAGPRFPEPHGVAGGLRVDRRLVDERPPDEVPGRRESPLLPEQGLDRYPRVAFRLRHGSSSSGPRDGVRPAGCGACAPRRSARPPRQPPWRRPAPGARRTSTA